MKLIKMDLYQISFVTLFLLFFITSAGIVYGDSGVSEKKEITITDITGRSVTLKVPVERVILGGGAMTHEIAAVDGDNFLKRLVGWEATYLSKYDIDTYNKIKESYPEIDNIPDVGRYSLDTFSVEKATSLNPDVVILGGWDKAKAMGDVEKLEAAGIPVVFLDCSTDPVNGPSKSVRILGQLYGKEERANEIADFYDKKISLIQDRLKKAGAKKPSVYVECGWKGPDVYADTTTNTGWGAVVNAAGGENIAEAAGPIIPEYLISKNPDKIVISGAHWVDTPNSLHLGYYANSEEAKKQLEGYTKRKGWENLDAVKNNEVYGPYHGSSFHIYNYIGIEALAKWFYPDLFTDFNPDNDLKEFHKKYMPYDFSGAWFTSLKE